MRPGPGEVLHFSEDPTIGVFEPHVAATAQQPDPYVWAVDAEQAPDYWFPRDCPRAIALRLPTTTDADATWILGPNRVRVHEIEYGWLHRFLHAQLFAYRLPARSFRPFGVSERPHAMVSDQAVRPLAAPERVPDLVELHRDARIELRVAHTLWPFVDRVRGSTVHLSVIRAADALPRGPARVCSTDQSDAPSASCSSSMVADVVPHSEQVGDEILRSL